MKKIVTMMMAALLLAACGDREEDLKERALVLCRYIPDHELREEAKDFMTADFYAALDTMFNHLPEEEAMEHEWLYYLVTGNGGTLPVYEVVGVKVVDDAHAVATINVRQKWEDGTLAEDSGVVEHQLYMEKVEGVWLMSDFDGRKKDLRHSNI